MSKTDAVRTTPASGGVPAQGDPELADASLGTLVAQVTHQIPELVRSELRLAQAEVAEKGKRAGIGLGMFSAAGLLAFFGTGVLLSALVLLLALVMPSWAAALVVAAGLFAAAALAGLAGRRKVAQAGPPKPERALEGLKQDVATVKGSHR